MADYRHTGFHVYGQTLSFEKMARKTQRRLHFDHVLPFWVDSNATFFVTACARQRGINHFCKAGVGADAIAAAQKYHAEQKWFCSIVVLMPDHVHLLVSMSP